MVIGSSTSYKVNINWRCVLCLLYLWYYSKLHYCSRI